MTRRLVALLIAIALIGCEQRQGPTAKSLATPPDAEPHHYSMFTLPPDYDGQSELPVIVELHAMTSIPLNDVALTPGAAPQLIPRAIYVAPSGPIFEKNGRFSWSNDIEENFARVKAALEETRTKAQIRKDRVVLIGYSQGAYAALGLAYAHPEVFAGAIAICPGSEVDQPLPTNASPLLAKRAFVLCYGEEDDANYIRQGKERIEAARKAGAKVEIKSLPKHGHDKPTTLDEWKPGWFEFIVNANKA